MSKRRKKRGFLVCPYQDCASRKYKTLSTGNITRCCRRPVVRVNGAIYLELDDAPEWQIIQHFVEHKRKDDPEYEIPYGSEPYRQAIRAASILYGYCRWDGKPNVELACKAIDVSFTHRDHRWRSYPAMWAIISKNFILDVIAKAKCQFARERQERERQENRAASLYGSALEQTYAAAQAR